MHCSCGPVCKCTNCRCTDCSCDTYDAVVVGAGIIGCATAYTLAKAGRRTLLLEQFPLPHTRGSSHGASRIIRLAYPELYISQIMPDAYRMWKQLEEESSTTLIKQTGMLVVSPNPTPVKEYWTSLQKHTKDGQEVELMDDKKLRHMFPFMTFHTGDTGCFDQEAATLYANKCLQAFQKMYVQMGGAIRDGEKLLRIDPGATIELQTNKGSIRTKQLALCCGGWSAEVLGKLGLPNLYKVCYWQARDNSTVMREQPCFIYRDKRRTSYGLPSDEYPGLTKICLHYGVPCDPDKRDVRSPLEEVHLSQLKQLVAEKFPHLNPDPAIIERCIYTATPDKKCIVDRHPTHRNIVYASGFSGHGFKLAPVIGVMLTDLLLGKNPTYRIKEFKADRFNKAKL